MAIFLASTLSAQTQMVQSYPLNSYVRFLDGQWEGIRYASDGNVYFASSSQSAHHGAAFFEYNPTTQQLTMLAEDITRICGEDPQTNPQGKIHSNIQEMHGWLYFTTHFGADDRPGGITGWTGGHLVGYRFTDTGSNNYFNTSVGSFHDYGVIYPDSPGYTSYSGIAIDPVQNYIYAFATGEKAGQVTYVFRYNAATDSQATRVRLDQVYGSFGASLYWFVDSTGDVWFAIFNDNGALHRIHHDTQVIDRYDNVLPLFIRQDSNTVDSSGDRAIQWMAPISSTKAVFTYNSGGMLYQFDSSKATSSSVPAAAFTNLRWIGPSYLGSAVGNNRVFWYQRAGGAVGHQGCDASDTTLPPTCQDYHLMSVSLDPTTGYSITDYGLIVDQLGRTVWRTPSMMTDGTNETVYLVGDLWTYDTSAHPIPGDQGANNTLRYHYSAGVESYIDEPRGEFFAVAHAGVAPGSVSLSPAAATLGPGQTQQFTATVHDTQNQSVIWSLSPVTGGISNAGVYQAPPIIASSQVVAVKATNAVDPNVFATALITLQPPSGGAAAQFQRTDTLTQGNWRSGYGADGYNVLGDAASYPTYVTVSPSGTSFWVWAQSTTDTRALEKSIGPDRVAATWYAASNFAVDLNLRDGNPHQVALYSVDWDVRGRSQTVTIRDAQTGLVLDTRTLSSFTGGAYLVWTITGHVTVQITCIGGINAVLGGIFFGAASPTPPVITQQPQNATVMAGQTATFSVSASSGMTLSYQWQFQAAGSLIFVSMPGATGSSYNTSATQLADNGTQFRCVVSNSSGSVNSTEAALTVLPVSSGAAFVTSSVPTTIRNNFTGWVGMKLTTGANPLIVSSVGRICLGGNSATHIIKFVYAASGADVPGASALLSMSGCALGQFMYSPLASPITLQLGTAYYLVSQELFGGDQWYDHGTLSSTNVAVVNSSIYSPDGANWIPLDGANTSYVQPNFQYSIGTPDPNPPFVTGYNLDNQPLRNNFAGWVGMKLTVGASPITVSSLGRIFVAGNSGTHTIKLVKASDGADVMSASVSLSLAGGAQGQFSYAALASPVSLSANTSYYLVSEELLSGDRWYDHGTVSTTAAAAVNSAVYWDGASWVLVGSADTSYVPPNFK